MQNQVNSSNQAAQQAVQSIFQSFNQQLKGKQAVKVLPQYLHRQFIAQNKHILNLDNIPRPKKRIQDYAYQDAMVVQPKIQGLVTSQVPVVREKDLQLLRSETAYQSSKRNLSSRYMSTGQVNRAKKNVKIQLSLNSKEPIEIIDRANSTAKSYRSVRQLQSQLKQMRSTYLKKIRDEAKAKMSMTQQIPTPKKKRVPRQFTFDINGQIMQRHPYMTKKTVFRPLKTKAVSAPKISNRNKKLPNNCPEQDNIEEVLQRADTKTGERKKRMFNNQSKRQVSHIPFIALTDNSKLIQNLNIVQGHEIQKTMHSTARSTNFRSTFTHHFKQPVKPSDQQLIDQDQQTLNIPSTYRPKQRSKGKQGSILKNSRFSKDKSQQQSQLSLDFDPLNVTRQHGIDKYYKINMPTVRQ